MLIYHLFSVFAAHKPLDRPYKRLIRELGGESQHWHERREFVFNSVLNTPSSYKSGIKHTMLVESRVSQPSHSLRPDYDCTNRIIGK